MTDAMPSRISARAAKEELAGALRTALAGLDARYRLPLALCYQEEMSQREAAAVLETPERTVSKYVNVGLAKLRKALERAGYPAAVAAVLGGLKQTAPVVPASFAGRVEVLVAQGAVKAGRNAAAASVSAAAKGGIVMKLIAGIVLAGAVAGGVAVVGGGGGELPAEKPKFPIPVWHPNARWVLEKEPYGGSGLRGQLDGPLQGGMWGRAPALSVLTPLPENGPFAFKSFDAENARIHQTVGGASGYLDGPLARARFGTWGYMRGPYFASSPNGRFHFFLDGDNKFVIRRIDLAEQVVTTFMQANWKTRIMIPADDGGLRYFLDNALVLVDAQGKPGKKVALEVKPHLPVGGVALDEGRGRLYASCDYDGTKGGWYVWYWDLKDGSFHGVLPAWQKGQPKHGPGGMGGPDPGPFKGTSLYPQMIPFWGPDDPEKNFLYILPNDTSNFYRLDLKKETIGCASIEGGEIRIIETGKTRRIGKDFCGWLPDGSFISSDRPWVGARIWRYKRTK